MGVDEEGTLAVLKAIRRELADSKVKQHRGRIPGLDLAGPEDQDHRRRGRRTARQLT
jgi:hypothetical protein